MNKNLDKVLVLTEIHNFLFWSNSTMVVTSEHNSSGNWVFSEKQLTKTQSIVLEDGIYDGEVMQVTWIGGENIIIHFEGSEVNSSKWAELGGLD